MTVGGEINLVVGEEGNTELLQKDDDLEQLGSDGGSNCDLEQPDNDLLRLKDVDFLDLLSNLVQLDGDGGREGELLLPLHEDGHCVGGWRVVRWRWACTLLNSGYNDGHGKDSLSGLL